MPFKHRFSALIILGVALALCSACDPVMTPDPPTATPTAVVSPTPICQSAWTWASGPGSSDFDAALNQSLTDSGLTVRSVTSSTYGETDQCDGSFHAMELDVTVELEVADAPHEEVLAQTTAAVAADIKNALPISTVPNVGRVTVRFVAP